MTPPLTVRSATRRFVVLTALRWFPVGLTVPVMVLLATALHAPIVPPSEPVDGERGALTPG